jgi:hypothetical protein
MRDDDAAVGFDDVAAAPAAEPPRDAWRLGHRRPWWQWNVLSLFVPLFLLVWLRELAGLPTGPTWLLCLGILAAWAVAPLLILAPQAPPPDQHRDGASAATPFRPRDADDALSASRFLAVGAAMVLLIVVLALAGPFVFLLAMLACFLAAAGAARRT